MTPATTRQTLTLADLPDPKTLRGSTTVDPFLYCSRCHGEYSANRDDYFRATPTTRFRCCGRSLQLVRRSVRLIALAGAVQS